MNDYLEHDAMFASISDLVSDPEEYLEHHGIMGQKWGVRRYQNPDGSLTAEGQQRYADMYNTGNPTAGASGWGNRNVGSSSSSYNVSNYSNDLNRYYGNYDTTKWYNQDYNAGRSTGPSKRSNYEDDDGNLTAEGRAKYNKGFNALTKGQQEEVRGLERLIDTAENASERSYYIRQVNDIVDDFFDDEPSSSAVSSGSAWFSMLYGAKHDAFEGDEDYLEHHGIMGQKWGVRRYQNEDGTLTEEGKARYNDGRETTIKGTGKAAAENVKSVGKNTATAVKSTGKQVATTTKDFGKNVAGITKTIGKGFRDASKAQKNPYNEIHENNQKYYEGKQGYAKTLTKDVLAQVWNRDMTEIFSAMGRDVGRQILATGQVTGASAATAAKTLFNGGKNTGTETAEAVKDFGKDVGATTKEKIGVGKKIVGTMKDLGLEAGAEILDELRHL